jgi:uncharacterized membrane protein YdjX (TVP38/TMEM64 family)
MVFATAALGDEGSAVDGKQNKKHSFPLWAWRLAGGGLLLALSVFFCWSYYTDGIVATVLSTTLPSAEKVEAIQELFAAWGNLAPLVYLLLVIAEVVIAPIPGTLLYLPGGMLFGGFWGGTITLIGNTIGAGLACAIMRSLLGPEAREKIARKPFFIRQRERIERHGMGIILLLRINPLTSSDLVSYAAGPTPIPVTHVMLGTFMGMAPLCYLQAYTSMTLFDSFPWLLWPLVGIAIIYLGILCWLLWRAGKKENPL